MIGPAGFMAAPKQEADYCDACQGRGYVGHTNHSPCRVCGGAAIRQWWKERDRIAAAPSHPDQDREES